MLTIDFKITITLPTRLSDLPVARLVSIAPKRSLFGSDKGKIFMSEFVSRKFIIQIILSVILNSKQQNILAA